MRVTRWRSSLLVLFVVLATSAVGAYAVTNVYLYDPSVVGDVDLNAYLDDGSVVQPGGKGFSKYVDKGPAPSAYSPIAISEASYEQLGASNVQIDGVVFVNHGSYYLPNKKAIVLFTVRVPNASSRMQSEFEQDLTLSLWVDWNQDDTWKPGEQMIHYSFNLASHFPTVDDEVIVTFLTSFRVPDVTQILQSSSNKYGNSNKDLRYLWARAVVAYDDPDMSPDGAQLFGEYEDYRIVYYIQTKTAVGGSR
jgi:hypothetical protein